MLVPNVIVRDTAAPAVEPITWAEMKEALRIDTDDDQTFGTRLITAARLYIERQGALAMIERTVVQQQDRFPSTGAPLLLHIGPVSSVTAVRYVDSAGVLQTLDPAVWTLDALSRPPRLNLTGSLDWPLHWPVIDRWRSDAVQIDAVAGFGTAAADVPETLKQAMYFLLSYWYEQRSAYALDGKELPAAGDGLQALIMQHVQTATL